MHACNARKHMGRMCGTQAYTLRLHRHSAHTEVDADRKRQGSVRQGAGLACVCMCVCVQVLVRTAEGVLQIITPLLGKHNVYNILAAVATGIALKVRL